MPFKGFLVLEGLLLFFEDFLAFEGLLAMIRLEFLQRLKAKIQLALKNTYLIMCGIKESKNIKSLNFFLFKDYLN